MNNRHNSFYFIHKALRAAMYEMATRLQHADFSEMNSTSELLLTLESLLQLFETHAHGEDLFFNKPLESREPGIGTLFEKEHEEDHRLSNVILELILTWRNSNSSDERIESGTMLFYAFNEFIAFNLYHMNKEELELNAALWRNFTDEEIKGIEQTLVGQIPPDKMMKYAHWLFRGLSLQDLYSWLSPIQQNMPEPVFDALMEIAHVQLPTEKFNALSAKLKPQLTQTAL